MLTLEEWLSTIDPQERPRYLNLLTYFRALGISEEVAFDGLVLVHLRRAEQQKQAAA